MKPVIQTLEEVRYQAARRTLAEHGDNSFAAAEDLAIGRNTLAGIMRRQGQSPHKLKGNGNPKSKIILLRRVAALLLFLLLPQVMFGQPKGSAFLLPLSLPTALSVRTNRTAYVLRWDSAESKFAVSTGRTRTNWSNRWLVTSNSVPYTNTLNYRVTAINAAGVESLPSYYFISNRVWEIRLREHGKTNYTVLERGTNSPAAPMRLWDVLDVTTGWQ